MARAFTVAELSAEALTAVAFSCQSKFDAIYFVKLTITEALAIL